MDVPGIYSENVRLGFYFTDLIFVVCQSTAKTAKIGSLENFRLYGITYLLCIVIQLYKRNYVHLAVVEVGHNF